MTAFLPEVVDVTAAIATLSRPDGLRRCLDAILSGTVLPAEVLIVDQSQDPATRLLIDHRPPGPVPVVYIHQGRLGLAASRNAAVAQARYNIVAVTDDDCVPDPEWIAALHAAFEAPGPFAAVTGRVLALGPDVPGLHPVSLRTAATPMEFSGKVMPWLVGTGGNCAVQREWVKRLAGYDERLGTGSPGQAAEDIDLFYRLLRAGARIRYEPKAVVYHERQSLERRRASRWSYGYGIGAFCGIWLRRGDPYALRILSQWLLDQCRILAQAARGRAWTQARHRLLSLRGTVQGLLHGLLANRATLRSHHNQRDLWDRAS